MLKILSVDQMCFRQFIVVLICIIPGFCLAQPSLSTKSKKAIELYTEADNYRVRGQLKQAIILLEQALEKDDEFVEAYYRLGIVYMSLKDYPNAIRNFEKGLSFTTDVKKQKVIWYDLAETLFMTGDYDQADIYISKFLTAETVNRQKIEKAKSIKNSIGFAIANRAVAVKYHQKVLSDTVNQFAMQYFPVLTADQQSLLFTRRTGFSDDHDEDLVISKKDESGNWGFPESISKNINSMYNEGTCTISADGRKIIFTSCVGREGFGSCDLFESRKVGNEWSVPTNLGINVNSAEWESQPSLSADGRTLYFVSDRRGGLGRRDIWVSTLSAAGSWTKAKNVGKPINTVYDELSPFIHVNNRTLYFASNGLTGFGGYDLFYAERDTAQTWSEPQNIGTPINNHEDQFSLFVTADGKKGYYSHEEYKPGGKSTSKIIEIAIPEEKRIRFASNYVKGKVTDRETKQPLKATIELVRIETDRSESLVDSDSITGEYLMVLTQGAEYGLYVNRSGYLFKSLNFNYSEVSDFEPIIMNVELEKIKEGSTAILENIFFAVDKYELEGKSFSELQKVIRFLNENPTVRVEIGGHTDNTGADAYNKQLSEKRAQSVHRYLIDHGISPKRLTVKGYGSEKPISDNSTENGKRLNRRIEFKLLK